MLNLTFAGDLLFGQFLLFIYFWSDAQMKITLCKLFT
jgi:hypothetical protein